MQTVGDGVMRTAIVATNSHKQLKWLNIDYAVRDGYNENSILFAIATGRQYKRMTWDRGVW